MPADNIYNEKELLRRVSHGDTDAFRLLFDTYRDKLYFYILQITSSKELSEDIVQDTFLKIWIMRDQLPKIEHFSAYIFRTAQNAVMNGLKRKATEAVILQHKLEAPPQEKTPEEKLHFKYVKEVIQKAVEALPERQKMVYKLRREEGRKLKEIAGMMGISEITVKRHLTEAQKTLRSAIRDAFPFDAAVLVIIFGLLVQ